MQDRVDPSTERTVTHQSLGRSPKLESLQSRKQTLPSLDVTSSSIVISEDARYSHDLINSLPQPMAGGRKRDPSSRTTSQADCIIGSSVTMAEFVANASEQRMWKRRKRSSSTPPAPRSSQLSTQLRSRRRSQSRAGSPATDMEQVPPSRFSARLARKIQPLINSRSSDIYTHLAGPDGVENLLGEPPVGSSVLSTSDVTAGSRSDKKTKGSRRRTVDLTDENAKRDLIEEWARLRQSQGTLPLSGIDRNACIDHLRNIRKGDKFPSIQLGMMTRSSTPDPELVPVKSLSSVVNIPSQETMQDVFPKGSSAGKGFRDALARHSGTSEKILDHGASLPLDGEVEQLIVPEIAIETPSSSILEPHIDEDTPSDGVPGITCNTDSLHLPESSQPTTSSSRQGYVRIRYTKRTGTPVNEAEAVNVNSSTRDSSGSMHSFDDSAMYLDSHEEFCMLDIPETLTLPWMPVASQLYVPPGLGKLISGMKEQLGIEVRARRRAEELYQIELSRRMSAEKIMEGLRTELEKRQTYLAGAND